MGFGLLQHASKSQHRAEQFNVIFHCHENLMSSWYPYLDSQNPSLLMESFNFLGLLKVNFDAFLDFWKNLGIQDGGKVPAVWK